MTACVRECWIHLHTRTQRLIISWTTCWLDFQPVLVLVLKRSRIQNNPDYRYCWWTIQSHQAPTIRNISIFAQVLIKYFACRLLVDVHSQKLDSRRVKLQRQVSNTGKLWVEMMLAAIGIYLRKACRGSSHYEHGDHLQLVFSLVWDILVSFHHAWRRPRPCPGRWFVDCSIFIVHTVDHHMLRQLAWWIIPTHSPSKNEFDQIEAFYIGLIIGGKPASIANWFNAESTENKPALCYLGVPRSLDLGTAEGL